MAGLIVVTLEEAVDYLTRAGGDLTVEQIQEDIKSGAPVIDGDKIDLVAYAAWLIDADKARSTGTDTG